MSLHDNSSASPVMHHASRVTIIFLLSLLLLNSSCNEAAKFHKQADDLYIKGKYKEALEFYDRALEINSKNGELWFDKGESLCGLGRYEEAVACYDRALELKPEDGHIWYGKGEALRNSGKYYEAITCYDKTVEFDPLAGSAWYGRGEALNCLGNYE